MWFIRVFLVMYSTAVCGAQTVQNDSSPVTSMPFSLSTYEPSTEALTVSEPPVPSLQLQVGWLDVFPSEKVELRCNISGSSDWKIVWHKDEQEQDADSNLSFSADRSILTITAAGQMHSGSYFCKGQHKTSRVWTLSSNSLKVTVYQNKPKATLSQRPNFRKMFPGESVNFTCLVDVASGWEYQWYHNGNEFQAPDTYTIPSIDRSNSGEYYCKAKRDKSQFYTEPSETTSVQVSDPPTPSLKLLSPWLDVFKGELVAFACDVGDPEWTYSWYKNQQKYPNEDESYLNITSVTQIDQGEYACKAHLEDRLVTSGYSNTVTVKVYDPPTPSLKLLSPWLDVFKGELVAFACDVGDPEWTYSWYKNQQKYPNEDESYLNITSVTQTDQGEYACKAHLEDRLVTSGYSNTVTVEVYENTPEPTLSKVPEFTPMYVGETVNFTCTVNMSSKWDYQWYENGRNIPSATGKTFSLPLSLSDGGNYSCKAIRGETTSTSAEIQLAVHEIPVPHLKNMTPWLDVFANESVTFNCGMQRGSGWTYTWYKTGKTIKADDAVSFDGSTLSISSASVKHEGLYQCKGHLQDRSISSHTSSKLNLTVYEEKPKPVITQEPNADKVYVGESVSLDCKVEISSGWEYLWNKDGVALPHKSRTFKILDANSSDNGHYECTAKREKSTYQTLQSNRQSLQISEIPVPQLKQMTKWLDVFPSERVNLSCGMEKGVSDWTYTWYKDEQKVQADDTVSFDSDARTLVISSAAAKHAGRYSCSGKLKSRPVNSISSSGLTLSVYETKPRVTLMQEPEYDVMHTWDKVSFSCHINVSSGWEYLWYKDGTPLPLKSGHNYNISSVVTKDTGSYTCQVKRGVGLQSNQSQAVKLKILERPKANILLLTDWSEVFATDSLVLRCEVQASNDKWNYTWFKEGKLIDLSTTERHSVTPQDDPEQSLYTCQGNRTGQPSYSKFSDSFKTKNLLLKRRLLLSISGCLFFGLIAVLLGCIVLRFIRKPAVDDYKPEEENLFLTMAQLKDRSDAPDPLVEYITDEGLNALPKGADENGTLPITTQEDQALTTETVDTEENIGGLVSFKQ